MKIKTSKFLVAAFSSLALNALAAHPVVFLHGWNSNGGVWDKMRSLLASDAKYDSADLHAFSYYGSDFGYSKSTPIQTVAEGIAKEITEIYYDSGEEPVDIVAHSMGGLVVRAMLANDLIDVKCIGSFVTLATPHYGQNMDNSYDILDLGLIGYQASQMKYASSFLWELADAWHYKGLSVSNTLCIAGSYATKNDSRWDGLVHAWSAALADAPVRYVGKCHSPTVSTDKKVGAGLGAIVGGILTGGILGALIGGAIGSASQAPTDAIYQCSGGAKDDVYVLVRDFLKDGTVRDQEALGYSKIPDAIAAQGGLFYQILDATNAPAVYRSSDAALVHTFWHVQKDKRITAQYLEHGYADGESQKFGVELAYGTMPSGTYDLTAYASQTTPAFTSSLVEVAGGRMTIAKLRCDGAVILPGDELPAPAVEIPEEEEPAKPAQPAQPSQPVVPVQPEEHAEPVAPAQPEQPTMPGKPSYALSDFTSPQRALSPVFEGVSVWDGWVERNGALLGTIQLKISKPNAKTGVSTAKMTLVTPGHGKKTARVPLSDAKDLPLAALLAATGTSSTTAATDFGDASFLISDGEYSVYAALNPSIRQNNETAKRQAARLAKLPASQIGIAWDGGTLCVKIKSKGKASISGALADGTKVKLNAQTVVGEKWCAIPVGWSKKSNAIAALIWIDMSGKSTPPVVEGLDGATAAFIQTPPDKLAFSLDGTFPLAGIVNSLLPADFSFDGEQRWHLPKPDTVKADPAAPGQVIITKSNGNPAALKLSCNSSTGAIKGNFKAYSMQNGKLRKHKVSVFGIMLGKTGQGFATLKGFAPVPFSIK